MNNLAEIYRLSGRLEEAETMFRQAIVILEKTLEPAHADVAMAQNNLAALYQDQQRYSEAELFYRSALAIQEKAFGQDLPR